MTRFHFLLTALFVWTLAACDDTSSGTANEAGAGDDDSPRGGGRPGTGGGGGSDDGDDDGDDDGSGTDGSPDAGSTADSTSGDDTSDPGSPDAGVPDDDATVTPDSGGGEDDATPPPAVRGPALGVDPTSIFFSVALGDPAARAIVDMRNIGDEAFTITEVILAPGSAPNLRIVGEPTNLVMNPGDFAEFAVFFDPVGIAEAEGTIWIRTSYSTEPVIVPIIAAEKGGGVDPPPTADPPCVRVLPVTLDFGRAPRGGPPLTRTFEIRNCGAADVRVQRLDRGSVLFFPTPNNFQWSSSPLPLTIAAGGIETVTVTYAPGRAGLQSGAIDVRTNVTGSETVRVNLRATAEPPPISDLDLHLVLNWDVDGGSDVDFHFVRNYGAAACNDCYFSNMTPDWGVSGSILDDPFLDYDDLEGPGPENINVDELADGRYRIIVHYYSDSGSSGGGGGGGSGGPTNATVEVWIGGTLRATYGPRRLDRTGSTWDVADLDWPSQTLTELGTMRSGGSVDQCR
jgi:hypothetical protein